MQIVFLARAKRDLRWFKLYYTKTFPEGRAKANSQFLTTQQLLGANPHIGHPSERVIGVREYHIPRIPFSFLYRVKKDRIEILRVLDTRADFTSNDW